MKTVDIFIDRVKKKTPVITTGDALCKLAGMESLPKFTHFSNNGYDLWREKIREDDEIIENTNIEIIVNSFDHFYTASKLINGG